MRAFIAIDIPDDIKERIMQVSEEIPSEGITKVKPESLHITLQFLGDYISDETIEEVGEAMDEFEHKKFEASFKGVSYFSGPNETIRTIFVKPLIGETDIRDIYQKMSNSLKKLRIKFEAEDDYKPHITIARIKRFRDVRKLKEIINKNAETEFGNFMIKSILLKRTLISSTEGASYSNIYERKL
jgi:2'-5' RNA ligase